MTSSYHLIVVGAGPAGLSAARTASRLGLDVLVLEALSEAGELGHPCGAAIAPHPGFVSGQRQGDSLHFPELDLTIPGDLVVGWPRTQRYISPGGYEMRIRFPTRDDFPIVAVDKPGLLRLLAEQAQRAGAKLRFGTAVAGLLTDGNRIVGVRTYQGELRAQVVLSAEGISRRFCQEAGLYEGTPPPNAYATIVWQELDAPAIGAEHMGQIATFGRCYTAAPRAMGTLDVPAPGSISAFSTTNPNSSSKARPGPISRRTSARTPACPTCWPARPSSSARGAGWWSDRRPGGRWWAAFWDWATP